MVLPSGPAVLPYCQQLQIAYNSTFKLSHRNTIIYYRNTILADGFTILSNRASQLSDKIPEFFKDCLVIR